MARLGEPTSAETEQLVLVPLLAPDKPIGQVYDSSAVLLPMMFVSQGSCGG